MGHLAREVTEGRLDDDPPICMHSPFRRLAEVSGKLLFLGCGVRPYTMMHGVEELVQPPYLFREGHFPLNVVDENGHCHDIWCRPHCFAQKHRVYN